MLNISKYKIQSCYVHGCNGPVLNNGLCEDHNREYVRLLKMFPSEKKSIIKPKKQYPDKMKKYMRGLKDQLFEILGGKKCSNPDCLVPGGCTDERCLQFDHKNGGGVRLYKQKSWYFWLAFYVKNPELARQDLQVLCANCNWIKRNSNDETRSYAYSEKLKNNALLN